MDEMGIDAIQLGEIREFINQPGNTIIFKGSEIDKLSLYRHLFEPLNIPLFLENEGFSEVHPDAQLSQDSSSAEGEPSIVIPTKTTLIAVYNANGKITVLQNDEPISQTQAAKAKTSATTNTESSSIEAFRTDMDETFNNNKISVFAASTETQGDLMTTIRKQFSVNGTYTPPGSSSKTYVAGKATTDYLIYRIQI